MNNKVSEALVELSKYKDGNYYVSFSGGKDSLVTLDLALRVGINNVVFCDTTLEFDETLEFVDKIESYYGIHIERIKPPVNFFILAEKLGFPSRKCRWCSIVCKFGPQSKFAIQNKIEGYITGLRSEESNKRRSYKPIDFNPMVPVKQINPIINWSEADVWNYIHDEGLPVNPLYQHFDRVGCWFCPYMTKDEWRILSEHFPEKYDTLINQLDSFADRNGILDKNKFIDERKWTSWANPIKKIIAGSYNIAYNGKTVECIEISFNADNENQIEKVIKVIGILTNDYTLNNTGRYKKLVINSFDGNIQKLNVLVEKAINCKCCGTCLSLCTKGALKMDAESIYIDPDKCDGCQNCLRSSKLKCGCIIRNVSPKRASMIHI
jgi:phosphoadenosine phosphosulfate reductase